MVQASTKRIDKFISVLPQYNVSKLDPDLLYKHHELANKLAAESKFELNLPGFD